MNQKIAIQPILDTVRQAGDLFLQNYKLNVIPTDKEEFSRQLQAIDEGCMSVLKMGLIHEFPHTPWNTIDEFDNDGQTKPLPVPEYWICDAMDGAIQYLQHIPGWTINLALIKNGEISVSVIYDPLANEMFWAQKGLGSFMNSKPIQPVVKRDAEIMVAAFEYGHQDPSLPSLNQQHGAAVTDLLNRFGVVRNYGPHGLQLAYVAMGRIDIFHQLGLDTFNWLAGILIASESGLEILNADGQNWHWGDDSLIVAGTSIAGTFKKGIDR
jgi:myo-inositol-1(or 4)-monophosphatase